MPPRLLAQWLSVEEARELQVYALHETLDPVGWEQTAHLLQAHAAAVALAGERVPAAEEFRPGLHWDDQEE